MSISNKWTRVVPGKFPDHQQSVIVCNMHLLLTEKSAKNLREGNWPTDKHPVVFLIDYNWNWKILTSCYISTAARIRSTVEKNVHYKVMRHNTAAYILVCQFKGNG